MNRNFTLCVLCVLFGYMSFITNQFWTSLYMQDVQKFTALHIALRMLPQAIVSIIDSLFQALPISDLLTGYNRMYCTLFYKEVSSSNPKLPRSLPRKL